MATPKRRAGFCLTCQKSYVDRYAHRRKFPTHTIKQEDSAESAHEDEVLEASDSLDSRASLSEAANEQAGEQVKKISGADFASQPIFVAGGAVGLGWLTRRVFGPSNALQKEEAYGISAGVLRLVGRHFLKNIQMQELTQANNDVNDFLLIGRAVSHYIGRLWQADEAQQPQTAPRQQAAPQPPQEQPEPAPRAQRNGHAPSVEDEAAFIQQQYAAAIFNLPSMGEAA